MSRGDAITQASPKDRDSDLLPDQRPEHSDDVLSQFLELAATGPRTASGTVRRVVDTVDGLTPLDRAGLAKRREVVAAALEMTQRLVHAPYDVGRGVVHSTVLVNVEVDVDIASQQATGNTEREEV